MRGWICGLTAALLGAAGCNLTSLPAPTAAPFTSLWGDIITVGQAEQSSAPALWLGESEMALAWVGADETGVHQDMRLLTTSGLSERVALPLPPVHPYAQQLAPAEAGGVHLLWLDAESEASEDGLRLFSAYVNPSLEVERGPIRASDRRTLRYALSPNGDGSLWTVWSGGLQAEPSLYAQYLDPLSRPRAAQHLLDDADWPALARANDGAVYLFWMQVSSRRVFRAKLGDGAALDVQVITDAPRLERGDRLVGVSAGLDSAQGYLFWTVARANGAGETWFASGALDATRWGEPGRLGVSWTTKARLETGYNSGLVFPARGGDHWLRWMTPAAGQYDLLAVAAQVDDGLAVVYLQGGEVVGYQEIVQLAGDLIGFPSLVTNRDRHLYLAWSQPTPEGYAELKVTATRRLISSGAS